MLWFFFFFFNLEEAMAASKGLPIDLFKFSSPAKWAEAETHDRIHLRWVDNRLIPSNNH